MSTLHEFAVGPEQYTDITARNVYWPATQPCEHCDSDGWRPRSHLVRNDVDYGRVCKECDPVLDEMFATSKDESDGLTDDERAELEGMGL